ncbi:pitrilysin family protein [Isosphaeraceae bacterium EP7]
MTATLALPPVPYTKTTLANGLDVIVRRQANLPIVASNLWYHVGSKNEERSQRGFAHLFEHLMFEGSEHYPGDFFKPLQRLGGSINGSTSADRTNYFEDVPAAHLELALAMESDRMGFLLPALDDHKLRVQKDVVKNEYRQNYANRPYGYVSRMLSEAMYPPQHPYSWLTIGVMEDVEAASRDDVEAFFRRYYVPANASLCMVGDLDESRAFDLAERYFGSLPGGTKALLPWAPPVGLEADVELSVREPVELDRIYRTWHTVRNFAADDAPLTLLADVLTRGKSGRLYRDLVMESRIAQNVSASQTGRELAGSFGITVSLRPGKTQAEARAVVDRHLEAIARDGVEAAELDRVKNGRLAGFIYALDNVGGFGGVADRLNAYNTYLGDPSRITSDFERFRSVTAEEVQAVASRYLIGRPGVILTVEGRRAATVSGPALDRTVVPTPAPAMTFRAPTPEIRTLKSGATLWVLPRRELPIVAGTVVLDGGAGRHPSAQAGLASLTASLMDEGTTRRSAGQIAEEAERMGTSLTSSAGWDGSYVNMLSLVPYLEASLDLVVDVATRPAFPEADFDRVRGQVLTSLKAERDSAENRAHRALLKAIYGPTHPYRTPSDGEYSSVEAITRDDLVDYHRRRHATSEATWVFAGDIDPDRMVEMLDRLIEADPRRNTPTEPVPTIDRPRGRRILLLDRPGAPQSVAKFGHVGLTRLDEGYVDALVFNQVLGGQFTSRLNAKLREEKGFTYGIRSGFDARRSAGPFAISASLQADKIGEALADVLGEVEALLGDRPPTIAELDDARRALIEGQARHFETPSALVSRYAGLKIHDLPSTYFVDFNARLEAVTLDSMKEAGRRQIHPDSFVVVVIGDAETTAPQLDALGWGEVERVNDLGVA